MTRPPIPLLAPNVTCGFPYFDPDVFETGLGVQYFKEAGVALISRPNVNIAAAAGFLDSFDDSLGFREYLFDPVNIDDGAQAAKYAGQGCYQSYSAKRTWNKDAGRYLDHIKELGHGSVLEAASYGFQFWGVDRALTHELVRHRMLSFSQTSQRFCDDKALRFVERPEYQPERLPDDAGDELKRDVAWADTKFQQIINSFVSHYELSAENLGSARDHGHPLLQGGSATEKRKHLNQVARECLPNCCEAPIVVTGNARAWRGFLDQRATPHADVPIRELAIKVLKALLVTSPLLFGDYEIAKQDDGTEAATTAYRKV
ncbi:MAG: FAD-dependent thymidylate synthase [Candidatus Pacebacteria bacterium]|nr:FAD-dependent thymidylate synthase [Candidatus Paceibacterota bacterium]